MVCQNGNMWRHGFPEVPGTNVLGRGIVGGEIINQIEDNLTPLRGVVRGDLQSGDILHESMQIKGCGVGEGFDQRMAG